MKKKTNVEYFDGVSKEISKETEEVIPFTQTPSENQFDEDKNSNNVIGASELFSFFTANIIKEEIVFTR